jgi:hypothetical protein
MKFLPGQEVLPEDFGTGMYFHKGEPAELDKSPLAKLLLNQEGVKSIFLGRDFVTVTKQNDEVW